ncbi:SDR family NAD(P)-dependent oxidoreductase [Anaerolineae bacterium CFX8]|nr:SDR family NAD(P)-dependent oxidoreductase [Anaerolineae bacterium CFX8]
MGTEAKRFKNVSGVKLALLARQMREQTEGVALIQSEPIAIIGMGCRFPAGANNPEKFWELLTSGKDAISEVPPDRWNINEVYDPDYTRPGKMNTRWGGFVDQIDRFDPEFFGITPREALQMDPQQRMVMEVSYEALENAGLPREKLAGSQVGVFIASSLFDYGHRMLADINQIEAYAITGNTHCFLANRLSFLFNFRGPSLAVDTACSSSLVAIHLAVRSLRSRDSDVALAGGVNAIIAPEMTVSLSQWGMLSPDGRCKAFDSRANGFVRSEGCGIIVLKRLSDALADGDSILALIRGTAVNQDGRSTVITAPNGMAQRAVLRQALADGLVEPEQITCIEAHGTGTVLGDPIEVEALAEVVGQPRADGETCFLSSVKTNIGHLEAAAGIAGLIKTVLALQHGVMPPHLHFKELNPHISLENTPFVIPTENRPWTPRSGRRFAGVSSFGFGGTNAHIVLEEAPQLPTPPSDDAEQIMLLPLSAHNPQTLRALAEAYAANLPDNPARLQDIVYTASLRRSHQDCRLTVTGRSKEELADRLSALLRGNWKPTPVQRGQKPRVVFVFSGQGPQWWAMGRQLMKNEPVFRESIERCEMLLRGYTDWSLIEELSRSEADSRLDETEIAQPAIFALQVALADLWRSWDVKPDAVVGHSIGEVAAAYVAGVLSLEDAIRVVYHRARLMQQATGSGKMASVEISEAEAAARIAPYGGRLSIAAVNSPTTTVLSGETAALDAVLDQLEAEGISCRMLRVNYAFHSAQMETYASELAATLTGLKPGRAAVPVYSTVTGQAQDGAAFDAAYWGRNVRQPVRFAAAVYHLIQDGFTTFLEISPHPVLAGMVVQCLDAEGLAGVVTASLRRNRDERETMLSALGDLYTGGYPVAWERFYPSGGRVVFTLPTYPWQRERYWVDPPPKTAPLPQRIEGAHPLLGQRVKSPLIEGALFDTQITPRYPAFLDDHRVWGTAVVPAAAYLEAALSAAAEVYAPQGIVSLNEVFIQEALILPEETPRTVQFHLSAYQNGAADFKVYSLSGEETWTLHVAGRLSLMQSNGAGDSEPFSPETVQSRCAPFPAQEHYSRAWESGIEFGLAFHGIEQLWRQDGEALAFISLPKSLAAEASIYRIHPALLDACIQTMAAALPGYEEHLDTYLPLSFDSLRFYARPGEVIWSHARLHPGMAGGQDTVTGDIQVFDAAGRLVLDMRGLRLKRASREALRRAVHKQSGQEPGDWFYEVTWQPAPVSEPESRREPGAWLIFADQMGIGEALAAQLEALGEGFVLVKPGADYSVLDGRLVQVNPASRDDFQRLIRDAYASSAYRGVVHLWGLDVPPLGQNDLSPADSQEVSLGGALYLLQALAGARAELPGLWLVTRGAQPVAGEPPTAPEQSPLWGLANTIFLEHPDLRPVCVDLDPAAQDAVTASQALLREIRSADAEDRVAWRGEGRYAARLVRSQVAGTQAGREEQPMTLDISARGVLDNLARVPMIRSAPGPGEVEVRVRASGLNFRDVLNALGMYPGDPGPLGDEFVGEIVRVGEGVMDHQVGDVVLGMSPASFSSYVTASVMKIVPKPASMSDEEAATIPITFMTAYYALHHLAGMSAGDRVLIHAAAGGVGMAAVQLAQRAGAEIFATAGSPEKRAFLKSLGVQHVMDSRTLDFADEIMQITGGRGVDVVLNSLAGEFIPKSLSVLADGGCFLEIGKTGIWTVEQAAELNPTLRYYTIYLGDMLRDDPALGQAMFRDLIGMFEEGTLRPLPHRVFAVEDAVSAFRFMAQAKHIGKLVLKQPGYSAVTIRPGATYLITGGLGGIGLHIAGWLVEQGARHLVLTGRSTPDETIRVVIGKTEAAGANVSIALSDVTSESDTADLLAEIERTLPPLRGVIHAAGALDDGVLLQQDWTRFTTALRPKLNGAWNLYRQAAGLPLDFLILFSAGAALLGSPGQGNYTAANAFLDSFAHACRAQGLPALSINWGAWEDTGMMAGLGSLERWAKEGIGALTPERGLQAFSLALQNVQAAQVAILPMVWADFARSSRMRPFFAEVVRAHQPVEAAIKTKTPQRQTETSDLLRRWVETVPNRRRRLLLDTIREEVIRVLGLRPTTTIDPRQPLNELGLDSLMAVELRNTLITMLDCTLPATLLFDYPTSDALADYLMKNVPALAQTEAEPEKKPAAQETRHEAVAELQQLSDAEAEALLLAELEELNKGEKDG